MRRSSWLPDISRRLRDWGLGSDGSGPGWEWNTERPNGTAVAASAVGAGSRSLAGVESAEGEAAAGSVGVDSDCPDSFRGLARRLESFAPSSSAELPDPETTGRELMRAAREYSVLRRPPVQLPCLSDISLTEPTEFCRICRDGGTREQLISPCDCRGTVRFVHKSCLERWLAESDTSFCEICGLRYVTERTPRYSLLKSVLLWAVTSRRELLMDVMTFLTFMPLAVLGTTMGMTASRSLCYGLLSEPNDDGVSNLVLLVEPQLGPVAAQVCAGTMTAAVVAVMAAMDIAVSTWLVLRVQQHAARCYAWWRRHCVVRVILPNSQSHNALGSNRGSDSSTSGSSVVGGRATSAATGSARNSCALLRTTSMVGNEATQTVDFEDKKRDGDFADFVVHSCRTSTRDLQSRSTRHSRGLSSEESTLESTRGSTRDSTQDSTRWPTRESMCDSSVCSMSESIEVSTRRSNLELTRSLKPGSRFSTSESTSTQASTRESMRTSTRESSRISTREQTQVSTRDGTHDSTLETTFESTLETSLESSELTADSTKISTRTTPSSTRVCPPESVKETKQGTERERKDTVAKDEMKSCISLQATPQVIQAETVVYPEIKVINRPRDRCIRCKESNFTLNNMDSSATMSMSTSFTSKPTSPCGPSSFVRPPEHLPGGTQDKKINLPPATHAFFNTKPEVESSAIHYCKPASLERKELSVPKTVLESKFDAFSALAQENSVPISTRDENVGIAPSTAPGDKIGAAMNISRNDKRDIAPSSSKTVKIGTLSRIIRNEKYRKPSSVRKSPEVPKYAAVPGSQLNTNSGGKGGVLGASPEVTSLSKSNNVSRIRSGMSSSANSRIIRVPLPNVRRGSAPLTRRGVEGKNKSCPAHNVTNTTTVAKLPKLPKRKSSSEPIAAPSSTQENVSQHVAKSSSLHGQRSKKS